MKRLENRKSYKNLIGTNISNEEKKNSGWVVTISNIKIRNNLTYFHEMYLTFSSDIKGNTPGDYRYVQCPVFIVPCETPCIRISNLFMEHPTVLVMRNWD